MKRVLLSILIGFVALSATAQLPQRAINVSIEDVLPDSIKYVVPSFGEGVLVFSDGSRSRGTFNISTIDQSLRFIDTDGSKKMLDDDALVDRVTIGGNVFIRQDISYLRIVRDYGNVILCMEKILQFDSVKQGGYGTTSELANIKTYQIYSPGEESQINFDKNLRYELKETPYLYRNGRAYIPTRKVLYKCFPDKKETINSYLKEHKVDFTSFDEVAKLLEDLK